jgi:hypothetical protein
VTSSDGETIDVPHDVIKLSNTINTMLQGLYAFIFYFLTFILIDLGMDPEEQPEAIPVSNVNSAILKKVSIYFILNFSITKTRVGDHMVSTS